MNSRTKRKLAYRAKNEKAATVRNISLKEKIFGDYNNLIDNNKKGNILINIIRNSKIRNSYAGGVASNISTRKYACGVQKLRKTRKSA